MQRFWTICLLMAVCAVAAPPQELSPRPLQPLDLLNRMTGSWILKGTIGGKQTTHDVRADWVLRREYLQIHEVSREKNADGQAAYEAIILVSFDPKANQYTCLWLDSTSGAGLTNGVTCKAAPEPNSIPLIFTVPPSDSIRTTFSYRAATDTWQWTIDDVTNGKVDRFADVVLSRQK